MEASAAMTMGHAGEGAIVEGRVSVVQEPGESSRTVGEVDNRLESPLALGDAR